MSFPHPVSRFMAVFGSYCSQVVLKFLGWTPKMAQILWAQPPPQSVPICTVSIQEFTPFLE